MSNAGQGRASGTRETVQRLHKAQREFYSGGPGAPLRELLAEEIVWSVPGRNAIAGTYEGIDQVMDYFARRREIASRSLTMHPSELLLGEGDYVAALTEGRAILEGAHRRWWTVGLYRVRGGLIAACWLLPLDMEEFDRIWRAGKRSGGSEPGSR
jgi:ketosteroid isomerase-like protein